MDIFDECLFKELTTQYAKPNLSADDCEELYMRFCNLDYLPEVQPYLKTMRYFGLGTTPEKKAVLSELKSILQGDDYWLKGLYYDLLLDENGNNADALVSLCQMVEKGYTNIYTKEKTHIENVESKNADENELVTVYSIDCPYCNAEIYLNESDLEEGSIVCYSCGATVEFILEDEEIQEEQQETVDEIQENNVANYAKDY